MWKLIKLFSLFLCGLFLVSADIKKEFDVSVQLIGKSTEEKPKLLPPETLQVQEDKPMDLSYRLLEPPDKLEQTQIKPLKEESGISCGEPKDRISYRLGVDYYLEGKYGPAEEELSKVVLMPSPFKPMAEYVLGVIYAKEGKEEKALELFNDSCRYSHIYQKASCESYYALSFKLTGKVPQNTDPMWEAVANIKSGNMSKPYCTNAVFQEYCQYVLEFYQGKEGNKYTNSLKLRKAIVLYKMGKVLQAEEIFKEYSAPTKPYRDIALYYLGVISAERGDNKSALSYASILETMNSSLSENLYSIISSRNVLLSRLTYSITGDKRFLDRAGIIAYNSGDYRLALYNFLESGNVLYAVYSYIKLGEYTKAYELLKQKTRKNREEYQWYLESAYWSDKGLEPILDEIRERYPDLYREYTGWFYFKRGDWAKAVMYLDDPYYKALAYFNMKDYDRVIQVLQKRNSLKERLLKAKAALFLGDTKLARSFLTEYTDEELYLIGLSYFLEGKYAESSHYFKSISQNSPLKPKALLKLGDALYNEGKVELAKEYYYQVLSNYPNSEYAKYATLSLIGMGGKEIGDKQMETLLENYLKNYPNSPMSDELKYQLAKTYIKNGQEEKAKPILIELMDSPLKYKAILELAHLEKDPGKKAVLLFKVYKEGNTQERKQARDELIEFYTQVGDKKSIADLLAEGEDEDKVKAIGIYMSLGDDQDAQKLAKALMEKGYRTQEFETYLLELYKASKDRSYLDYLKLSKDPQVRPQALYLSALDYLKENEKRKALEDLVDITVNHKDSPLYNKALIEAVKLLIDLNAKRDASCLLDKANLQTASQEELSVINSLRKELPKCEVR
jgi:TolA-binding protein